MVPEPRTSRIDESNTNAHVNPIPVPAPSSMERSTEFLEAKVSALYIITQFTTMSAIKMPSDSANSGGKYALINSSTIVTKEAITTIKHGMRISFGIRWRISEITVFEHITTNVAARPIASPFFNDVVTARAGHKPRIATNNGLNLKRLFVNSYPKVLFFAIVISTLYTIYILKFGFFIY
jgi:hypothetical protein